MLKTNLQFFGENDDSAPEVPTDNLAQSDAESAKPESITITKEALNAMDVKAKTKGEQSIIKQLGLASKDDLPGLLEKLQKIQEAEAKAELEKPELERISGENKTLYDELEKERQARIEAETKLTIAERKAHLQGKGFAGRDLKLALLEIDELLTDDADWMEVADKYITDNPLAPPPPEMAAGTGNSKMTPKTIDPNLLAFMKGAGIKSKKE